MDLGDIYIAVGSVLLYSPVMYTFGIGININRAVDIVRFYLRNYMCIYSDISLDILSDHYTNEKGSRTIWTAILDFHKQLL